VGIYVAPELKVKVEVSGGFQRIKPDKGSYRDDVAPPPKKVGPKQKITQSVKEWVYSDKPYYLFMTLTFRLSENFLDRCKYIDDFIKYHNKMAIGREYYKGDTFMTGFAFFEEHPSREFEEVYHVHMLAKPNHRYAKWGFTAHEDIFRKAAAKVYDAKGGSVFNNKCIHIREAGDDGTIDYCFVQMWDGNIDNVKRIGKDGLSDHLQVKRRTYY
jgi:hypothetical protein